MFNSFFVYPGAVKVLKIELGNSAVTIGGKGKTAHVKITYYPIDTVISGTRTAFSNNSKIATVSYENDPGGVGPYTLITAVANDTTTITVKDSNGAKATCQVTVTGAGSPAAIVTSASSKKKHCQQNNNGNHKAKNIKQGCHGFKSGK